MKIVLDINIIFSALLNTESTIATLLYTSNQHTWYSIDFLKQEIDKHRLKLAKISKMNEQEIIDSKNLIYRKINFIHESLIPEKYWIEAHNLASKIDADDVPFVALAMFYKAKLWTGDKKLYEGFTNVINTQELKK